MDKNPIIYLRHILDCIDKIKSYASHFNEMAIIFLNPMQKRFSIKFMK